MSFPAAVGFSLAVSPHNLPVWGIFHAIGAGVFVFSLWTIGLVHLAHVRASLRRWYYRLLMFLLSGPLIAYAVLYIVQDPLNFAVQKPALIGIATALLLSEAAIDEQVQFPAAIAEPSPPLLKS